MHYVLMIHTAESRFASLSPEQHEAMMQDYGAYTKDLFASTKAGDCAALEMSSTATCLQVRDGKRIVKDGPFADTREQLGGYYSLEAASEDEAIAWASKIPGARTGTIEVRPLRHFTPSEVKDAKKLDPKTQKQYLLLIYESEASFSGLSEAERNAVYARYREFGGSIRKSGQFIAGDELDTVKNAKTVRVDGDRRVVKDGPFAETREQLGGYYRVLARDLDEALALASRIPAAETGTIEVRPVMDTSKYA